MKAIAAWLLLAGFRLARCGIALMGLAQLLGAVWASLLVLIVVLAGFNWVLRVAAFVTVLHRWHWPWPVAVLFAAPRLVLVLPGLATTLLARLRHPRPRWTPYRGSE